MHVVHAGAAQCLHRHRAAHAVQGGQRDANWSWRPPQPRGPVDILLDQFGTGGFDWRPGDFVGEWRAVDRGFDLPVGGETI